MQSAFRIRSPGRHTSGQARGPPTRCRVLRGSCVRSGTQSARSTSDRKSGHLHRIYRGVYARRPHAPVGQRALDGGGAGVRARRGAQPRRRSRPLGAPERTEREDRRHLHVTPRHPRRPLPFQPHPAAPRRPHDHRRHPRHQHQPHAARPGRGAPAPAPAIDGRGGPAARSPRQPQARPAPGTKLRPARGNPAQAGALRAPRRGAVDPVTARTALPRADPRRRPSPSRAPT